MLGLLFTDGKLRAEADCISRIMSEFNASKAEAYKLYAKLATVASPPFPSDPFLVLESMPQMQEWKKLRVPAPATPRSRTSAAHLTVAG